MKGDRERCLEAGMDGYVSKPIRAHELYAALDELPALRNLAGPEQPPPEAAAPVDGIVAPTPLASAPSADVQDSLEIDWNEALVSTGGDHDLMRTVIDVFLRESPKMLEDARYAAAANDQQCLRRAGHTLKGSCGYFAVPAAYNAALSVEQLATNGNMTQAKLALERLAAEIDRLRPALTRFGRSSNTQEITHSV
jgi:HPt (histidine-containing phosphotransfer) domain-containing protein